MKCVRVVTSTPADSWKVSPVLSFLSVSPLLLPLLLLLLHWTVVVAVVPGAARSLFSPLCVR
jgi:hypothetical protein